MLALKSMGGSRGSTHPFRLQMTDSGCQTRSSAGVAGTMHRDESVTKSSERCPGPYAKLS
jgi:hypothetical protein